MSDSLLVSIHLVLLLLGATQCIWLMQLIAHKVFYIQEPTWLVQGRRTGLMLIALSMLLGAKWCVDHTWIPWVPDIVIVGAIDLYFLVAIASAYWHSAFSRSRV